MAKAKTVEVPTVKNPYLIQRCRAKEIKKHWLDTLRTGEYLDLDYMGSSEFEFGAIPKFQREVNAKLKDMAIFTCEHNGVTLYYLAAPSQEQAYAQVLRDLIDDKLRLKERSGLKDRETNYQAKRPVFDDPKMPFKYDTWLDLCNGVVIARQPQILKNLKKTIPNSVQYMDSNKR